jgi:hypothetical protein
MAPQKAAERPLLHGGRFGIGRRPYSLPLRMNSLRSTLRFHPPLDSETITSLTRRS